METTATATDSIASDIQVTLQTLVEAGDVFEIRAVDVPPASGRGKPFIVSGYYDSADIAAKAVAGLDRRQPGAVYVVLNRINPALFARSPNRLTDYPKATTSDNDVIRRRWLLLDFDVVRPSGISSTEAEHDAAQEVAYRCREWLRERSFPEPILADSGNGWHLLYRIDLDADDGGLVERVLHVIKAQFATEAVAVDTTVASRGQITKLYGTTARKGHDTPDRPHRRSRLVDVPDQIQVVPFEMLQELAGPARPATRHTGNGHGAGNGKPFDIDNFISRHDLDVGEPKPWQGGRRWVFRQSPLCEHHAGEAFICQHATGALSAGCHHNHCTWTWADLREKYQPKTSSDPGRPLEWDSVIGGNGEAEPEPEAADETPTTTKQPGIRNFVWEQIEKNGKIEYRPKAIPMERLIRGIMRITGDWPRRVGKCLFVDDAGTACFLDDTAALFGWLAHRYGVVNWKTGTQFVPKTEFFAELARTAKQYAAIETMPHYPRIDQHYYIGQDPKPGDGKALDELLGFFEPASDVDRQLLLGMFATPLWGGGPGARPAFLITSSEGRGRGKTKLAVAVARLYGGEIDVSPTEDFQKVKQRFLTPEAAQKRVALLDNIKSLRFSHAELESLITNSVISGWQLYVGNGERPNYMTWILTLNGASLSTDLAQRIVEVKLATPKYRADWDRRLFGFIEEHRDRIVADLFGFFARPKHDMQQASRWATWESEVLARVENAGECWRVIMDRRHVADVEHEESELLEGYFASRLTGLGYDVDRDDVFISNVVACNWYNHATGDRKKTTGVTRTLGQMFDEGQLHRLQPARAAGTGTRGFRFVGPHCDVAEPTKYDLGERINKVRQDNENTGLA